MAHREWHEQEVEALRRQLQEEDGGQVGKKKGTLRAEVVNLVLLLALLHLPGLH